MLFRIRRSAAEPTTAEPSTSRVLVGAVLQKTPRFPAKIPCPTAENAEFTFVVELIFIVPTMVVAPTMFDVVVTFRLCKLVRPAEKLDATLVTPVIFAVELRLVAPSTFELRFTILSNPTTRD